MSRHSSTTGTPHRPQSHRIKLLAGAAVSLVLLAGCDENGKFALSMPQGGKSNTAPP